MSELPTLIQALRSAVTSSIAQVAQPDTAATPWAVHIASVAVIVAVVTYLWTVRLRRVVRERTAELESKHGEMERESADRRHALEALQVADKRLHMAMEAAELRTWHWDVALDRFEVMGERTSELGPPLPDPGVGLERFLKSLHPEDVGAVRAAIRRTMETGDLLGTDFRVLLPDGTIRWKVGRGCVVRDAKNGITSLVGVVLDVTDRVRRDEELRLSEERYRELFENANDIIYTHDLAGTFTGINKAAERVLGYSQDDVPRITVQDVVVPEQLELAQGMVARKVAGDVSRTEYELDVLARSGRRVTLEVNTRLVKRDGVVVAVQGIARDVTERKRLEWQLGQSQKMEAVGQLAGGIAHDFNNLLAVILGYATFIERRAPEGSDDERDVGEIRKAGERATRLTHQLLAFARRETVRPRVLDLTGVVLEMEQLLRRTLGDHVELETALAADLWPIMADYGQLEQVLVNLAINARDAMPGGGTLTLDTENVDADDAYVSARPGLAPGRYVRLRVSDTGTGMTPDVAARAFEPFFTTKPKGQGTGLGLATIYGIVTGAGGHVQIYSEPGLGTTFTVLLGATDAPLPEPADRHEPPRGHGETILVVEDEAAMLEVTRRLLEGGGYDVLTARGGEGALRIASGHAGEIHLLLTDVVMPGMLGREVAAKVSELRPGIPVLYMSGYAQAVIGPMGDLSAGHTILDKPFTEVALFERVADALSRARA